VRQAPWRQETVGTLITDVRLRRLNIAIGRRLRSGSRDFAITVERQLRVILLEQLLDVILGLVVLSLAEVMITDATRGVDKIIRGPELIAERLPDCIIVVERDRIRNAELLHCPPHVVWVFFEGELGSMDAENDEACVFVSIRPGSYVRQRSKAV